MKKIINASLIIALVAITSTSCKKEENNNNNNNNNNNTPASIVGSWRSSKLQVFLTSNDTKLLDTTFTGIDVVFNANGTYTQTAEGETETGNYKLETRNGKNYIIATPNGEPADTIMIENLTNTSFTVNGKEDAIRENEETYAKITFNKR